MAAASGWCGLDSPRAACRRAQRTCLIVQVGHGEAPAACNENDGTWVACSAQPHPCHLSAGRLTWPAHIRAGFKVKISERGYFPSIDDQELQMVLFRSQGIRLVRAGRGWQRTVHRSVVPARAARGAA